MAKVAYGKLGLVKNTEIKEFMWNNQKIEVTQYLPTDDKLKLYERVLSFSVDDEGFYNITKVNFWLDLEIVFTYTNITFTDKQKEDLFKLYDLLKGSGFLKLVKETMDPEELAEVTQTVWDTIINIYKYNSSALGIMKAISTDYDNLNLDASEIQSKLADPNNLGLLRDVLTKLG